MEFIVVIILAIVFLAVLALFGIGLVVLLTLGLVAAAIAIAFALISGGGSFVFDTHAGLEMTEEFITCLSTEDPQPERQLRSCAEQYLQDPSISIDPSIQNLLQSWGERQDTYSLNFNSKNINGDERFEIERRVHYSACPEVLETFSVVNVSGEYKIANFRLRCETLR